MGISAAALWCSNCEGGSAVVAVGSAISSAISSAGLLASMVHSAAILRHGSSSVVRGGSF